VSLSREKAGECRKGGTSRNRVGACRDRMQEDGVGACKEKAGAGRKEVGAFSESKVACRNTGRVHAG